MLAKTFAYTYTFNSSTCFIPHGILNIDVPIIVFHIINLGRKEKSQ